MRLGARYRRALGIGVAAFWLTSCGPAAAPAPVPPIPKGAVAIVDGQPIHPADVQVHLRPPPPRVGSAPAVDPRVHALDAAIRVRLFAREARRRGLPAPDGPPALVEAHLVQGLLQQERARRPQREQDH